MFNITREDFDKRAIGMLGIFLQVFAIVYLISNFSITLLLLLLLYSITIGVMPAVFVHRAWSHKAWKPNKYLNRFGLLMYTIALGGSSIAYVAIHREHHKHTDQPGDPHSPHLRSRFSVQFLFSFTKVGVSWVRNCVDLLRDPDHMWFAKYYWHINILFWGALYVMSPYWCMMLLAFKGVGTMRAHGVNSLLHNAPWWIFPIKYSGYGAANSLFHAIVIAMGGGESWHKNHHDDPNDWRHGRLWYEIDFGAIWVRLFVLLGWASLPERKLV